MTRAAIGIDLDRLSDDFRSWLDANWHPDLSLLDWRARLVRDGWARPSWPPTCGGRSLPVAADAVVSLEIQRAGAVGAGDDAGVRMAAATIFDCGNDDQRERFVGPTLVGAISWCQLFSEPDAGSDLAAVTTTARRDGDEWVVTGRKMWNTSAANADFALLLARTDWDAPKHDGLTYFVLPMRQPGVVVRPLRQMNGHATFNEVLLDGARVPAANVVGEVNKGWLVAVNTLGHERRLTPPSADADVPGPEAARAVREAAQAQRDTAERFKWYPQRSGRVDLIIARAQATGRGNDPVVRQEIARLLCLAWTTQWTRDRADAARRNGRRPGGEAAVGKLANSRVARTAARVHALIAGSDAMLAGADDPSGGVISEVLLSVPAISIAGGTDEIQRNILGERILGLPREPDPTRGIPFRDVPKTA